MKEILSIIVFSIKNTSEIVASAFDLSDFGIFKRGQIRQILTFSSRTVSERTPEGKILSVNEDVAEFMCHSKRQNEIVVTIVTQGPPGEKYRLQKLAFSLIERILKLESPKDQDLEALLASPPIDKITSIQKELDETKDVMMRNIDTLLERGEKIEDLVKRSSDLSDASKIFYYRIRDYNRCCTIV